MKLQSTTSAAHGELAPNPLWWWNFATPSRLSNSRLVRLCFCIGLAALGWRWIELVVELDPVLLLVGNLVDGRAAP